MFNIQELTNATLPGIPDSWFNMEANIEITYFTQTGVTEIVDGLEVFSSNPQSHIILAYVHEPKDAREVREGEAFSSKLQLSGHLINPLTLPTAIDFDTPLTARFLSGALANLPSGTFQLQPVVDSGSTALTGKMGQKIMGFFSAGTR